MSAMLMKVYKNGLAPVDDASKEALGKLKVGSLALVNVRTPRNPLQHRLLWHLARLVYENTEHFLSAEHVVEQIKIGTGFSEQVRLHIPGIGLVIQERGKSIAFESMPKAEFDEWFERALDYIVFDLIPGVEKDDIRREIEIKVMGWAGSVGDRKEPTMTGTD